MATSPKPLYLAKSVKELNSKVSSQKASSTAPRMLCKSADRLYLTAKDKVLEGDQESGYVLFMRYLDLVQTIRSSKEFKSNKKSFEKLLDVTKFKQALDEAEKLSTLLNERYERLNGEQGESESSNTKKPRLATTSQEGGSGEDQIVPNPQETSTEPYSGGTTPLLDQVAPVSSRDTTISPERLYSLLSGCPNDVLVLDCRLRADFVSSHVDGKKYPQWMCVPEEAIKNGNLQTFLSAKQKKMWEERQQRRWIVLTDASSTSSDILNSDPANSSSVLISVRDALTKWDSKTSLCSDPVMLDGGYDQWYLAYAPLCIGKWQRKDQKKDRQLLQHQQPENDASLNYPSFPDISVLSSADLVMEEPNSSGNTTDHDAPRHEIVTTIEPTSIPPVSPAPEPAADLCSPPAALVANGHVVQGSAAGMTPSFNEPLPAMPLQPLTLPTPIQPLPPAPGMVVPLALEGRGLLLENELHPLESFVLPAEPATFPERQTRPSHVMTHTHVSDEGVSYRQDNQMPESQGHWTPQNVAPAAYPSGPFSDKAKYEVSDLAYQQMHESQAQYYPQPDSHAQTYPQAQTPVLPFDRGEPQVYSPPQVYSQPHSHPQIYDQAVPRPVPTMQSQPYSQVPETTPHSSAHHPHTYPHPSPTFHQPQTHSTPQVNYYPQGPAAVPHHPQTHYQPEPGPIQPSVTPSQHFPQPHPQTVNNPRVALGPIPDPPNYDQAAYLPSHPPTPLPLPPPISLSQVNQVPATQSHSQTGFAPGGPPLQDPNTVTNIPAPHSQSSPSHNPAAQGSAVISRPNKSGSDLESPIHESSVVTTTNESESQVEAPANGTSVISRPSESGSQAESSPSTGVEITSVPERAAVSAAAPEERSDQTSEKELALAKREKALEEREKELQQAAKDQQQATKNHLQQVLDEKLHIFQQEQERMKKEREEERTRFVEQFQHEQEQLRRQQQQLQQDREEMQRQAEEMQRQAEEMRLLRSQYEKAVATIQKQGEQQLHYWDQLRQQETQQQLVMHAGLPTGWEKRLDRNTGRFYYIDHSTKTTHWNPPTQLLQYQAELQRQKQRTAAASLPAQPGVTPAQLPHSAGISRPVQPGARVEMSRTVPVQPKDPVPPQGQVPVPPQGQVPMPPKGQVLMPPQGQVPTTTSQLPHAQTALQGPKPLPCQPSPSPQGGKLPSTGSSSPQTQTSAGKRSEPVGAGKSPSLQPLQHPSVDRSTKPTAIVSKPAVNRHIKPMSMEEYKQRQFNLQPVHGGLGKGITGMRNLGNTCFMSSVLQCLCSTIPLVQHFVTNKYRMELNRSNPLGSGGALAEEFFIICRAIWFENYRHISPRDFKDTVSRFAPYFAGYEQHDSQEFLVYLLDGIHEDLNKVLVKDYVEVAENDGVPDAMAAQRAWDVHKRRNDSIIVDLFHGMFKSTLTCLTCGKQKVMFEPFVSLSVPLPQGRRSCSYSECLKMFTSHERISGDNKWHCPNCKTFRDAEKWIKIWRLPPILLLHFKRFIDRGTWREKNPAHVSFPIENLDLSPYMASPKPPKQYSLYAISNHTGTLTGGHYTACCKNPRTNRFYFFDDHEVRDANQRDLSSPSAYLLFYTSDEFKTLKLF